ncbi:MAG: hypothetical protein IPH12_13550 [Saprospirales bacterium]|nr:hypothetical protein [Saprospirales bacterium]MBK8922766.1 hypothetical protein [Saprospirales bacterium]
MKRLLIKNYLMTLAFVLGGLLFVSVDASAQLTGSLQNDNASLTNWVTPNLAVDRLTQEIASMEAQLQSAPSDDLKFKKAFYEGIVEGLESGQPVVSALNQSYARFTPTEVVEEVLIPNALSAATWNSYYQEAVLLLIN